VIVSTDPGTRLVSPKLFANLAISGNPLLVRPMFFFSVAALWVATAFGADIKPADSKAPIFRIFSSTAKGDGGGHLTVTAKQPLLVISSVADVQLSTDRKAVRIVLTSSDAKKFADITRKYNQDLLLLEGNGKILEAMRVSSPVQKGVLEFSRPDDDAVVDYLRQRFRLK
jgi:hypothetical protein